MGRAYTDARPALTSIMLTAALAASCATRPEVTVVATPPACPTPIVHATADGGVVTQLPTREIARRAAGYTVFIKSGRAYGAGVVFDRAGRVLTCDHVLLDREDVTVHFEGRPEPLAAKVIESDAALDLAVLQLEGGLPAGVVPAADHGVGAVGEIVRGDEVYAMGAPRKMRFSFQRGVVSFDGRPFEQLYYVQTDLAMNPGSSGGPVVDEHGRLVGIASFILRGGEGLSFALPIDYALRRFDVLDASPAPARQARLAAFESWLHGHRAEGADVSSRPASDLDR
jgi:S1-C subfamily serine protease